MGKQSEPPTNAIVADLNYLAQVIHRRIELHLCGKASAQQIQDEIQRPIHRSANSHYLRFIEEHDLSDEEHLVLLMALAPHIQPGFFDQVVAQLVPQGGDFPQIGGIRGQRSRGFLPTGETVLFVLAGNDLDRRFEIQRFFSDDHIFARRQLLSLEPLMNGEPIMSGQLSLNLELIDIFAFGRVSRPRFSIDFPAQHVTTDLTWDDLVLPDQTQKQIHELVTWINHGDSLLNEFGMRGKIKPGYRALFHGPPGTGKTLTASLLGKSTGRDVYRVDLSMVVSKYIGETEKNLAKLFERAKNKDWILFFDEADALFGKRTNTRDAHDKYANQEVAYLLQRIEMFDGLTILASNFKTNIDEAFMRRFQASIHFPMPQAPDRERLWSLAFPGAITFARDVDLGAIASQYELTGAHIINVVQYALLQSLERGDRRIQRSDIVNGIRREVSKEGKVI